MGGVDCFNCGLLLLQPHLIVICNEICESVDGAVFFVFIVLFSSIVCNWGEVKQGWVSRDHIVNAEVFGTVVSAVYSSDVDLGMLIRKLIPYWCESLAVRTPRCVKFNEPAFFLGCENHAVE